MDLTEEHINNIAPDPASVKAGNSIFRKTAWSVLKSERAVWAEIQGSGKKPYYTQIDINDLAFKCTCPSRKFPCKHGLGLGYYLAKNGLNSATAGEEPLWVKEWIDKRLAKKSALPKEVKPIDLEKVKEKKEDKWVNAVKDIQQVELWLKDFVNQGIMELPNLVPSYWEALMARMVDVKMAGINTFFKALSQMEFNQNWEEKVLDILGKLHLIIQSIKNHENLEPDFKEELAMLIGWSIPKQELLQNPQTEIVDDEWIITKVYSSKEDSLQSQKVFLFGLNSQTSAYILEFAFGSNSFENHFLDGEIIKAKLAFYPGVEKNRAILKLKGTNPKTYTIPPATLNLEALHTQYIEQNIAFPWVFEEPYYLSNANLIGKDGQYYIVDKDNNLAPLINFSIEQYINVLAISQGGFFDAFVLRKDEGYELMSFVYNQKITVLHE